MENARIEVYDISGKQLEKRVLEGNEMNLENYKPGVYIIKTEDSKGKIYTGKFVKR